MINGIFTIMIIGAFLEPAQPPSIVILTLDGETTTAEQAHIVESYAAARAFWGMEKGSPTVEVAEAPPDALSSPPVYPEGTVVVIDTDELLLGKYRGLAAPHRIWVVSGALHLPAVFAHEMGHAEYGLPHWRDCIGLDIMCNADAAYPAHSIGCRSLEAIGRACARVYLPEVG